MRLIALILFIPSLSFAFGDMSQPGVGPGTSVSVGSLTASDCIKTGTTGNPLSVNCDTSKNVQISSTIVANFLENYGAADGTAYYTFLSSMAASLPSGAEISNLLGRIRWYKGDNSNAILNGIEGVCSSDVADESITCRGASLRTYTAPGGTLRTSVGADVSARASYSGGTEITAESGTAFVGERIWMAPYFSDASIANVNNFHGLWIYNEATAKTVTNGIKLSGAGGTAFTNDINLQNGETISNATDGVIKLNGTAEIPGADTFSSTTTILKGPVGIGTASPSASLDVRNQVSIGTAAADAYTTLTLGDIYGESLWANTASADANTFPVIRLNRSKGTLAVPTGVTALNDGIGRLSFRAHDGAAWIRAAQIDAAVDSTPGTGDMPTRLAFSVTVDGASSPSEAMRISNNRNVGIQTTTPGDTLDVNGGITGRGQLTVVSSATVKSGLGVVQSASSDYAIKTSSADLTNMTFTRNRCSGEFYLNHSGATLSTGTIVMRDEIISMAITTMTAGGITPVGSVQVPCADGELCAIGKTGACWVQLKPGSTACTNPAQYVRISADVNGLGDCDNDVTPAAHNGELGNSAENIVSGGIGRVHFHMN